MIPYWPFWLMAGAGWLFLFLEPRPLIFTPLAFTAAAVYYVAYAWQHHAPWAAAVGVATAVWGLSMLWRNWRRRPRRAPRSLGAKSKARIEAMVRKIRGRQQRRARPVLRPVPGDAR